jgi:raffinose/stachyose/melibiose transport system permease protein
MRPRHLTLVYLGLLPTFLLLAVFSYIPIIIALTGAFYEWDVGGVSQFTGLSNFRRMLHDEALLKGFRNLLYMLSVSLTAKLFVPLIVAVLIFRLRKEGWRYFYRVLFVIPMVVPGMVNILLWGYIYSDAGLLTMGLQSLGVGHWTTGWLDDPRTTIWAIIMIGFPFVWGFNLLIYYAGLSNISESVIEAAEIDGASSLQRFFHIELPLATGQIKLLAILSIIQVMQQFELPMILTKGGPGYESMLPGYWMYLNGFSFNRMGYACAIGLLLFLLMLGVTILNMKYIRSGAEVS